MWARHGLLAQGPAVRINQPGEGLWPNQFVASSVVPVFPGLVGR